MKIKKNKNYDDYDENDIYDDDDYLEEDEEEKDPYDEDDDDEEYDESDDSFDNVNLLPTYDKDNPVDFIKLMEDYNSGVPYKVEAACELAVSSLDGLVRAMIREKYSRYSRRHFDDLLQQGRLGICKGLSSYDPTKGKPSTYFYFCILHEMQEWLNLMVNKTTSHYDGSVRKIKKVIEKYKARSESYTAIDLAIETELPLQTIERSLDIINASETSFEGGFDSMAGLENILMSDEKSPEQIFIEEENLRILDNAMHRCLDTQEIRVIELTYGIHGVTPLTNKAISKEMNLPSDRIRRYLVSALCKLRHSKELRSIHSDMLRDTFVEINEEDVIPMISDADLDLTLDVMKDVEIDF